MSLLALQIPLAHAGHWFASILYMLPVIILGGGIWWQRRNDKRLRDEGGHVRDEDVPFTDE
ncbi:MAG: hypothetical protein QM648_11220 [Solirubrobacterales bacterium]